MLPTLDDDFPNYPKNGAYFDSATRGLQPNSSLMAQFSFSANINYTVRKSLHSFARKSEKMYVDIKQIVAEYTNSTPESIAWTPNVDIASNQMIHSFLSKLEGSKPTFVTSIFEHHSILSPLLYLKSKGKINLKIITLFEEACIREYLEDRLSKDHIAMFGHTTQMLGLTRNIKEIAKIIREKEAYSIIDFSRTAGQTEVDLAELEVDIGLFDGSIDLLGPPSSGFIYVRPELISELENPFPSSGNVGKVTRESIQQIGNIEKFEMGAPDLSRMIGLKHSLEFLEGLGKNNIQDHKNELQNYLIYRFGELETFKVIDPLMDKLCDNEQRGSSITLEGNFHPHDIALFLDESYDIKVRSGLLCAHPSINELNLDEVLQISTHVYNTKEEIDSLINGLQEIIIVLG